ncbi:MAG: hypothetical protein IPH68_10615 [Chitinophagaceae bacterium]|nr:hypothetical protein [Chitinophagaceae bacterium]MBK7123214.1 hypothetical protein [Chitinophagaceae bacterium]MBK7557055.1 hypothetical protein [Chitinophagaceae bacterium]MBK9532458.1 hypothetical protein [Chitinophagaceae bacterium]HQW93661.1 hypothetical protein [Ferruginibacter sp.]
MKIIVFIFSIYLLVLPGLACAETGMCADEPKSSVNQTAGQSGHEQEDCGAFCTCSCCVHIVSVNVQSPHFLPGKISAKRALFFFYNNISLPSNCFGNIWQPPKIS